jgi:replicative DNA helicase
VTRAFPTGEKPVRRLTTRLGRTIRATANHKFLTIEGWRRLDELTIGARLAQVVRSEELARLAESEVYWDEIAAIETDGTTAVYDLTVAGLHNFVAGDIVAHNSIEQDADVVVFIFREKTYYPNPEDWYKKNPNKDYPDKIAEIIVAKHRHGPTRDIKLRFIEEQAKFDNLYEEPGAREK